MINNLRYPLHLNVLYFILIIAFTKAKAQNYSSGGGPYFTCSGTFYDNGGISNYGNNQSYTTTICPSTVGQCISAAFTAFSLESGFDYLTVYDGNTTSAPMIPGSSFSGTSPGTIKATTINTSGCLTFKFVSDGQTTSSGWKATISCGTCGTYPTTASQQDCIGANTICGNQSVSGTSLGSGSFNDVNSGLGNSGCLNDYASTPNGNAEHQSHWYYFSPSSSGALGMTIAPSASSTDYDWAIWGPYVNLPCPPSTAPIRCSSASSSNSSGGATGIGNGAGDADEGAGGDGWVSSINVVAGQKYILMLDNWNATSAPYTLSWQLAGGASLDCALLPIELVSFTGTNETDFNLIKWVTAIEKNNESFMLERSLDGFNWETIHSTPGKNNSQQSTSYQYTDYTFTGNSINYYRLKQTDVTGHFEYSPVISIHALEALKTYVSNVHPNPTNSIVSIDFFTPVKGEATIQIVDFTGTIVKTDFMQVEPGKNTLTTKMDELNRGIYILKIDFDKSGFSSTTRLIKN